MDKKVSANGLQKFSIPQGRYGAPRPPCSMGEIIHNQTTNNREPTGVKSVPATNYQGYFNGPYPNAASQSTPNMGIEQRIPSNIQNPNFGNPNSYGNYIQNGQVPYNVQHTQQNMAAANQGVSSQTSIPKMYNNQQYNNIQQPHEQGILQNQNVLPSQPPSYPQNMFNNQYIPNMYPSGNLPNSVQSNNSNAFNNQQTIQDQQIVHNPNMQNEMLMQQQMQSNIQPIKNPQMTIDHYNTIGLQNNMSSPYMGNQQHQDQQGMVMQHQQYPNVDQQFHNLNLNNQLSASAINGNYTAPSQFASNANMLPEAQNQTLTQPTESNKLQNVNYPVDYPNTNQSAQNIYGPISQYPIQNVSSQNIGKPQGTLSYHNVIDPHLHTNQNAQQNPLEYQQNLAGNPVPQRNAAQISQHQMLPPLQPHEIHSIPQMTNVAQPPVANQLNSEISGHSVQANNASQPIGNSASNPPVYNNQMYSSPSVNDQNNANINKQYPQDSATEQSLSRPVSSAKESNVQMSRHNIINESNSAPSMTNNVLQENKNGYYTREINPNAFEGNAYNMADSAYIQPRHENQKISDTQDDDEEPHFSSKLERPQSLLIQKSEDEKWEIISDDKDSKDTEKSLESNLENNLKAVKINENITSEEVPPSEADDTSSAIASNHLTNQGYFDIKFYHNKLW